MKLHSFDPTKVCPKCGGTDINWTYHKANDYGHFGSPGWRDAEIARSERIDKFCRKCSYEWAEKTLA